MVEESLRHSSSLVTHSCLTLCDPMNCSTPGLPVHHQLPEFTQTHVLWVGDAIQQTYSLSSLSPPVLNRSQHQGLFKWVSLDIRWPKYWSFSFNNQSFQWTPRTDLLAVQGTLKSLLQHHSSKASILQCSAFFIVQLSHPYMTTGKTIALTRWTFVGKVMTLLFNTLSRLVLPSKEQASFNFMVAVTICSDFGVPQNSQLLFPLFPHLFATKWWDRMPWS